MAVDLGYVVESLGYIAAGLGCVITAVTVATAVFYSTLDHLDTLSTVSTRKGTLVQDGKLLRMVNSKH